MITECYATSLRVAARRVSARYDEALAPVGVNVAQWAILLRVPAGDAADLTIQELADRLELERSTVARNLRVLERAGLVALGSSSADRRATTVTLTAHGSRVVDDGRPLWEEAQRQMEQLLGQDAAAFRDRALAL